MRVGLWMGAFGGHFLYCPPLSLPLVFAFVFATQ